MAARTQGFSLFLSDICYAHSHKLSISNPPFAGTFTCGRHKRVAHPVQEYRYV